MKTVTIAGGGNLGHVLAGFLGSRPDCRVRLLTGAASLWSDTVEVSDGDRQMTGRLEKVSDKAADVVPGSDYVLLCLPGYAIGKKLLEICPHITEGCAVGSVVSNTGFFHQAFKILPGDVPLFGFQRVPFIARIREAGRSASIMGHKKRLFLAVERSQDAEAMRSDWEDLLQTPVSLLQNFYEAALSNSNPILHPARLYELWHDWEPGKVYPRIPMFYEEWGDDASRRYVAMDRELQQILRKREVRAEAVPDVLTYYECSTPEELTRKIRSIDAFKGIAAPMRETGGGFEPDLQSRYFLEDFNCGLMGIIIARPSDISTPVIDETMKWGQKMLGFTKENTEQ